MSDTTTKKSNAGIRINIGQRAKLLKWCEDNKTATATYDVLAVIASNDLGFTITYGILQNHWVAVNGPRQVCKPRKVADEATSLEIVVADLARRVAALERRPFQAGLNI